MKKLMTIGYEGALPSDFIATLQEAKVSFLIDIRELPLSRRKGFSKKVLAESLSNAGIEYRHFRELGDPKQGREAARAGRTADFKKIYSRHMKTAAAQGALVELLEIVGSNNTCLLCYERDPNQCHRTMVAAELSDRSGIGVVHLGVRAGAAISDRSKIGHRTRGGVGQGAAAA